MATLPPADQNQQAPEISAILGRLDTMSIADVERLRDGYLFLSSYDASLAEACTLALALRAQLGKVGDA